MSSVYVYRIRCKVNDRVYIGSTVGTVKRKCDHFGSLKKGRHCSPLMLFDWQQYGEDFFIFDILEVVDDKRKRAEREQYWINAQGGAQSERCYNTRNALDWKKWPTEWLEAECKKIGLSV